MEGDHADTCPRLDGAAGAAVPQGLQLTMVGVSHSHISVQMSNNALIQHEGVSHRVSWRCSLFADLEVLLGLPWDKVGQ